MSATQTLRFEKGPFVALVKMDMITNKVSITKPRGIQWRVWYFWLAQEIYPKIQQEATQGQLAWMVENEVKVKTAKL